MTSQNKSTHQDHHKNVKADHDAKGKNLSSASKEQVKKVASQGGKSAHSGSASASKSSAASHSASHGKQGFAAMPKAQVKEIAAKGGRTTHSDKSHK